jgi:hypothetical protein
MSSSSSSISASFSSIRSKVRSNFSKSLPSDLSERLESKLFLQSEKDESAYRQLYKVAVNLLKDELMHDQIANGKLGLNEFLSRILIQKSANEAELKELEWEKNEEKAIENQMKQEEKDRPLVEAVKNAKAATASNISSPSAFSLVAYTSAQLFLVGSCNLSYSFQALKALARAENLDQEETFRLNNYFTHYLFRAFLHVCHREFTEALNSLQEANKFHMKFNSSNQWKKEIIDSYSLNIRSYFDQLRELVSNSGGISPYQLRKLVKDIPKTAATVSERQMKNFQTLQAGENAGKAIVTKVLKIVENSCLSLSQYSSSSDWPFIGETSLNSNYHIPAFTFLVVDANGTVFPLSVYNVHGKVEVKEEDILIVLDPTVKAVGYENSFVSCVHAENPNFLFLNFKHWPRNDIAIFYS